LNTSATGRLRGGSGGTRAGRDGDDVEIAAAPSDRPGSNAALALDRAREIVLAAAGVLESETVALGDALGRVLAEDVRAIGDVPPFDNSAMDGFAVAAGSADRTLEIVDESRAGAPAALTVADGTAIRISTGALLPLGAEAVVPVEHVREASGSVTLMHEALPGQNVRRAGEDMRAGELVLSAGTGIAAAELAAAAAAGSAALRCSRRPRLGLVATGDELVDAGEPLGPGQIHDSNALALAALATGAGALVTGTWRAGDDAAATREAIERALAGADVVVVSGGVSVGPHDHVKDALEQLGVQERFWRVALRPGRPTWFGERGATLVFGLPGNPVSAFVTFLLFVRPALMALQGADPEPVRNTALLTASLPRNPDRSEAVRVALAHEDGALRASPTGAQGSHVITSLLSADALAIVPAGEGVLEAGSVVTVELIRSG
jgi:molybdopterin molybdotransferase